MNEVAMASSLDSLEQLDQSDSDIVSVERQIKDHLVLASVNNLRNSLGKYTALADPQLVKLGVLRIHEAAVSEELDLISGQAPSPECMKATTGLIKDTESLLRSYAKSNRDVQAMAVREYQKYALQQMKEFTDTYGGIQQGVDAERAKHWTGFKPDWQDADYKSLCDAMAQHLLPISQSYLEQPVAVMYSQVYDKGWSKLRDQDKQDLTVRMADIVKTLPDIDDN
jgi:hypothetical protein